MVVVPKKIATRCDVEKAFYEDMPRSIKVIRLDYKDIFSTDLPPRLPPVRIRHEFMIELEGDTALIHCPIYKLNPLDLEHAKIQIQCMPRAWIHQTIDIPLWSLGAICTTEGRRSSVLYQLPLVNKKTIKNKYPLPLPKELFDRLGGFTIFSSIDLCLGYWQMPLRKEDIPNIAFKTRWGLYEFLVVPFGVSNAPALFMNLMKDVLADYLDDFVVVLLNDILVYSKAPEDHEIHLRKVLQKL